MSRRRRINSVEPSPNGEIMELNEVTAPLAENPVIGPTPEPSAPAPEPAEVPMNLPEATELKERASKEEIEAAIQERLSRKTTSQDSDPFVPSSQLENEVKTVAKQKGFPLSRGTEIGARLMARSIRSNKK